MLGQGENYSTIIIATSLPHSPTKSLRTKTLRLITANITFRTLGLAIAIGLCQHKIRIFLRSMASMIEQNLFGTVDNPKF